MIQHRTKIIALLSVIFFVASVTATIFFVLQISDKKLEYADSVTAQAQMLEREKSLDTLVHALETTVVERASVASRHWKAAQAGRLKPDARFNPHAGY